MGGAFQSSSRRPPREIGKLVEPYLATFADFLLAGYSAARQMAAEGDYPAVDHEISVTCTAEDLGRLFHTLADQMERDDALLPLHPEQLVANTTVTFTSDSGETTRTTTHRGVFSTVCANLPTRSCLKTPRSAFWWANDDGLPFYLTAGRRWMMRPSCLYSPDQPRRNGKRHRLHPLTMLEADDEATSPTDRVDADMTLVLDPADPNAFSVEPQRSIHRSSIQIRRDGNRRHHRGESAGLQDRVLHDDKHEPDENSGLRIVYNGEGLTSLTATDGEKEHVLHDRQSL